MNGSPALDYKPQQPKNSFYKEGHPMAEIVKKEETNVKGKVVSIGTDVHKVSRMITAVVKGSVVVSLTSSSAHNTHAE